MRRAIFKHYLILSPFDRCSLIFRLIITRGKKGLGRNKKRIGLMICTLFHPWFIVSNISPRNIIAIPVYRTWYRDPVCGIFQILISRSGLKRPWPAQKKREIIRNLPELRARLSQEEERGPTGNPAPINPSSVARATKSVRQKGKKQNAFYPFLPLHSTDPEGKVTAPFPRLHFLHDEHEN